MDSKVCFVCIIERSFDQFYNKDRVYEQCNIQRSMKRYYGNKEKLSKQRKLYFEKNRVVFLAKSEINQQNRNYERIIYKQQIEELKKKL